MISTLLQLLGEQEVYVPYGTTLVTAQATEQVGDKSWARM